MMPRTLALAIACALVAAPAAEAARKQRDAPKLAELARRTAPVHPEKSLQADAAEAARSYEDFLQIEGADPAMRAKALRRLGDLRLAAAETLAAGSSVEIAVNQVDASDSPFDASERQLDATRSQPGTSTQHPDAAVRAAALESVAAYRHMLEEYPGDPATDAVLYQLARALEFADDPAGADAALDSLVAGYPQSRYYPEAQFRRGERFFSAQRYADAERAYAAVLSSGAQSEFGQQARYKLGWSLFKQSRDEEASEAFLTLLDTLLADGAQLRPATSLSRAQREIAEDASRALAITFAAADGPEALRTALGRHRPVAYEAQLYQALGDLYVEKERYQDGAEAYRAFARAQPMDPQAPLLLLRATEAYAKGGFASLVLDGKRELVSQYGPRSAFWAAKGTSLDPAVSAAVQTSLLDLAQHHHAAAQRGGPGSERDAAIRWYREYLDGFDDTPQAPATRLLLADLLFDGARFEEAAGEYERAAYGYATSPDAARAGYAALVAYDKASPGASEAARPELTRRAIESSLRFADTFPAHAEVPAVLTRTAKALFDAEDRVRAETVAQRVLALGARADVGQQRIAWTIVAHTSFDAARYPEAEAAYTELLRRLPPDDPLRGETTDRLAASVYRQAEAKREAGDPTGAAHEFLRVAAVAPSSPTRATAEFDAATLLLGAGEFAEAASVLEAFRRDHPGHALQAQVTSKLAVAYLEGGRPGEAAVELERVADNANEAPDVRRSALWQAAELYASSGNPAAARRAYGAYVGEFPQPFDAAIEARHELAVLAAAAGDSNDRDRWFGDLIAADAAAGAARTDRSRLLAAEASLELARPLDAAARAVRLSVPLDRALASRKKALEAALAAYGRASDYAVAPVTTAATYATADLYRDFGRALMQSERPRNLSAEELEQYDLLLEEQAFPFEEKAIGIHERNARRAAEGVYDEWVRKSYAALAELQPGRFARVERDGGAVAPALEVAAVEAERAVQATATIREAIATTPTAALDSGQKKSLRSAAAIAAESGSGVAAELVTAAAAAAAVDPAASTHYNRLGIALRQAGRFAESRAAYGQAIAADPGNAEVECNLAILLDLYLGQSAEALPHYERGQSLAGEGDGEIDKWVVEVRARLGREQRTAEARE